MASNPIAEARRRLGITQRDLGLMLGVAERTVSSWECRERCPGPDRVDSLRTVLGLSDVDVWKVRHRASEKVRVPARKERIW